MPSRDIAKRGLPLVHNRLVPFGTIAFDVFLLVGL